MPLLNQTDNNQTRLNLSCNGERTSNRGFGRGKKTGLTLRKTEHKLISYRIIRVPKSQGFAGLNNINLVARTLLGLSLLTLRIKFSHLIVSPSQPSVSLCLELFNHISKFRKLYAEQVIQS